MRRLLCIVVVMATLPASAQAAEPLAVEGGRLVDGRGRAVVLHGVNVVYKLAPYAPDFTRADARRVRGWGMNAIRLGVSWRALEPERGADTVVALPRLAYPRGLDVRAHGVRVVRRAPLTLRGAGRASITITRR